LRAQLLEALEALRRRSLLERGQQASFSLQSVVMEYLTDELGERLSEEIVLGHPQQLRRVALAQAQAKDYVHQTQVRLLVQPLLQESVFTETFDAITAVAISPDGQYWAAGRRGEVRLWREAGQKLHLVWQAHTDQVYSIAFSPHERTLASGSLDGSVKLWEVASGTLLWSYWHTKGTTCLAFAPDGSLLASGGLDTTVRLWDPKLGTLLEEVPHPGTVFALAWSPDGRLLASGDFAGTIRIWQRQPTGPARCMQTLSGHSNWVRGLAFAPGGSRLASASWDGTIKLWELESGRCLETLEEHTERVQALA